MGVVSTDDVLGIPTIDVVYEPNPANRALYADRSERFQQAFKQNRPLFRDLNHPRVRQ
jgi:hypothetical protein